MNTHPDRLRQQHVGVLSDGMWSAHARLRLAAAVPQKE